VDEQDYENHAWGLLEIGRYYNIPTLTSKVVSSLARNITPYNVPFKIQLANHYDLESIKVLCKECLLTFSRITETEYDLLDLSDEGLETLFDNLFDVNMF
jgi:hypothetical protein